MGRGDDLRRYEVTGIHPVLGHQPGKQFTAALPPAQEKALIEGRALRRVHTRRSSAKK